jgi:hypothetical protein
MPREANPDSIVATYIDGVLEIHAQLPEESGTTATKVHVSSGGSPVTRGARELRDLTGSNTLPARYRTHQAAGARGEVPDAKRRTAHFGSTDTARTLRGAEPHPILPVRP